MTRRISIHSLVQRSPEAADRVFTDEEFLKHPNLWGGAELRMQTWPWANAHQSGTMYVARPNAVYNHTEGWQSFDSLMVLLKVWGVAD